MSTIDTSQLLVQLRAAAAQAQSTTAPTAEVGQAGDANFTSLLKQSIDNVNSIQQESGAVKQAFELGDPSVSLPQAMIAGSKAKIAFQSMVTVRNKVVEAYQEIMRMPV